MRCKAAVKGVGLKGSFREIYVYIYIYLKEQIKRKGVREVVTNYTNKKGLRPYLSFLPTMPDDV